MHEFSLMADLMRKIEAVARDHGAKRVRAIRVKLGALSHMSPEHFREHFDHAARGTLAEGAELHAEVLTDVNDPSAQSILLDSVDVEE